MLRAVDRARGDPVRVALLLLRTVAALHPGRLQVDTLGFARRLGVRPGSRTSWPDDAARFLAERAPHLLYPARR
jgi:hypothetical protein